jgi:hypothetical protein
VKQRAVLARRLSPVGLALLLASCGGGGAPGTTPLTDGSGTNVFGDGSGTNPLGSGSGTPPFGSGSGGGGGTTGDGLLPPPDPAVTISDDDLQGTVFDSRSGTGLGGASVQFSATTLTTGVDGSFSQASAAADPRLVLQASATNYETLYTPTEVLGSVPSVNRLALTPYGETSDITVSAGGTVGDVANGASVTLPANALSAVGGGASPPVVNVRVTSIAVGTDPHLLSGDYTDDNGVRLEAFGAANLGSAVPVEVAAGQTLTLRIPVSTRSTAAPSTATLYFLDSASGQWVEQGPVSITSGAYVATVSEFGQYMVGAAVASPVAVTGCVNDDSGAPAANVRMELEGISYTGTAQVTTDATGAFSLPARVSSRVVVSGRRGSFLTNSAARDVASASINISPCLTLPSTNAATMRLTWGEFPRDIDSHLRTPDGAHVYYASKGSLTQAPFSSLDVDDVTGFGPEVTTIRRPKVGIYRFYLHNFSNSFNPGMTGSPTRVDLNYAGRSVVFAPPPLEGSALYWHLFDLYIAPNCTMTLYRYNRWRTDEPQNPNASTTFSTATECVPA